MPNAFLSDVRLAVRTLLRARGFTGVTVLILGAGLALCVSVAAVLNAYLRRGLPYPASDRLFSVQYAPPGRDAPDAMEALDWRTLDDVVEHPIAWDLDVFYLRGEPLPEAAPGAWVTRGFVHGFGIVPAMGRGFEAGDFEPGRPQVALISHRLWMGRFGGDRSVLGRRFEAYVSDRPEEAETFTVVGVLPERFWHLNAYTEVLAPLRAPTYPYMVRLREGVRPAVAADRISALVRAGGGVLPPGWRAELRSTHAAYVAQVRPVLLAVGAAIGLVMLMACANVAVLLLLRAAPRRREIAVRKALGASAGQIARMLVAEAIVLGAAATALGLVLGRQVIAWTAPVVERQLGRAAPGGIAAFDVDLFVVLAGAACGLVTTGAFMLAPLLASSRVPVGLALAAGQRGATGGPAQRRAQSMLIALEVSACLTLLVSAVLMVESGIRMLRVDFGLQTQGLLAAGIGLRERSYPDIASRAAFYERLLARAPGIPGGRSLALSDWWPLQPPRARPVGRDERGESPTTRAGVLGVSAGYFDTLGIPIRDGRPISPGDRAGTDPVAVVSETLARRLWPARRAVGERLRVAPASGRDADASPRSYLIVGVAGDVRQGHADEDLADVYVPMLQGTGRFAFAYVRVSGAPAPVERELRAAVAAVDADVPLSSPRMLDAVLDQERARPRFLAALLAAFASLAAVLALVGLYGVMAYAARQREREVAVRMAIGADSSSITRLFVRQGAAVLGAGLALGVCGAVAAGRVLEAQLFGVQATDPVLIAATTTAFSTCALIAIWWPARRAASIEPARALNQE